MANIRNGNTFYIDTQSSGSSDNLEVPGLIVLGVIVTSTSSNPRLILQDTATTPANKIDIKPPTGAETYHLDLSDSPVTFPNGIKPSTVVNVTATVILKERNR